MKGKFDWYQMAFFGAFALAVAVTAGIATVTWFNVSFSDSLFSLGGSSIDIATAIGVAALVGVWLTNDTDLDDLDDMSKYVLLGAVGLLVAVPFIPQVGDVVTSSDAAASAFIVLECVAYAVAAWMG